MTKRKLSIVQFNISDYHLWGDTLQWAGVAL